jgi:nicotine blue oxidoreductase
MNVAGLLLAAGAGRRFGHPKALIELDGRLLVEHAAAVLREGGCDPVIVILGAAAEEVRTRAWLPGCVQVDNPGWPTGMGSSLRTGLLAALGADAVLVLPVDVPSVTAAAIGRVASYASPTTLARATYDGTPGHPVLLGSAHWPAVITFATGDTGARPYLATHPPTLVDCTGLGTALDIDRPTDLPS